MAGHGPLPKDPTRRVRRNRPRQSGSVRPKPDKQPEIEAGGEVGRWWSALGADPRAVGMTTLDWLSAQDTAVVLSAFCSGDMRLAGEVRIRKEAVERRLRELAELGLPAVEPDAESDADTQRPTARARRGPLTAV